MNQAIVFLAVALVFVPLAVRLGLGSVLGYLLAGVAIGPLGLALVSDPAALLHTSELGVVLMLFVIGLELEPQRLWAMRRAVFGGGSAQMAVCAALLMPVGLWLGWTWQAALVASLALALSSTAIVVGLLQERHLMALPVGRHGFSMLLFQDIAAIPLLGLAAALGSAAPADATASGTGLTQLGLQAGAVVAVVLLGRFAAYPAMRFVATLPVRELFTGLALLLVLGVAALMQAVGLSMGLGAFMAGVLLAGSPYRHALESDLLPFKGLLLGLFFIAVGMSMQLGLLASQPLQVGLGLLLVVALKALGLWLLGRFIGLHPSQRTLLAVLLSQVGEFAFVVLAAGQLSGVLPTDTAALLTLIAALSMATTPLLLMAHDRWLQAEEAPVRPADAIEPDHAPVLLAGFGRYGQIVARLLLATGIRPTVIDHDADTIDSARRAGFVVHFGDATEADLLAAAGAAQARVMVVAIDDPQQASRVVALVREHWPQLRIVARARDAVHAMDLMEDGVHHVQRELFESSLRSGRAVLEALDFAPYQARQLADDFRRYSEGFLRSARADRHNQDDLIRRVREAREQFERQMQADLARQQRRPGDGGWQRDDGPPA
ncbi:monovalent cation:proton antiporter-2 (CPA2) family protein [Hydrogenophaga sp. IBVHS2]|uniref:monovalent cation:proton antiporter-2 (CPA2) family protein n=1 Tax=Hydrogenophaga sp. IBVHS2 TaxID=1985170 RepID=UPI000A2D3545|nr:monovalent cation:proton antiporter-2 (CPA2) family protein [Hydrogenophaga sp. IBVHS2]OSZ67659.1 hypothetical protein CAP38_02500 [Hydrogenophaga sp. IBVHS2]